MVSLGQKVNTKCYKMHAFNVLRPLNDNRYKSFPIVFFAGKYSTNNIPTDDKLFAPEAGVIDASAAKKVDEIMPLLYQTSIGETDAGHCDGETAANDNSATINGGNARSNSHKSYRKRVKTKPSRKHVGFI